MPRQDITSLVEDLGAALHVRGMTLACAESCTGGLISSTLTDVSGSSDWFTGAVVAYANAVKTALLDVPEAVLAEHGAVSEPVVRRMAEGVARTMGTRCAVAVSGVAGPTGGTPEKPVGTVWIAARVDGEEHAALFRFGGSRAEVKRQTVLEAVTMLSALLREEKTP